jgi:hypothetical protein
MRFNVLWQPAAEDELADLWNNAPDRADVARAADTADDLMSRNPHALGESRAGAKRIVFLGPLAIDFEVRDADHTVLVLRVRRPRRPR